MINVAKEYLKKNRLVLNVYEFFFQKPIINYFKKPYSKKVLFSYSTYHFNKKNYTAHSNHQESLVIAKIFDEMGYIVDIYNNNREYKINFDNYDVVFGEGTSDPMSVKEWVKGLTESAPHLFNPSTGGGSKHGATFNGNTNTVSRSVFDKMSQQDRSKFAIDGGKVVDK